jgi:integrator complex subunit 3
MSQRVVSACTLLGARFLSGRLSDGIVADLVRFIIVGFHPNNKLLQSQVVPRWALLGWILTSW